MSFTISVLDGRVRLRRWCGPEGTRTASRVERARRGRAISDPGFARPHVAPVLHEDAAEVQLEIGIPLLLENSE